MVAWRRLRRIGGALVGLAAIVGLVIALLAWRFPVFKQPTAAPEKSASAVAMENRPGAAGASAAPSGAAAARKATVERATPTTAAVAPSANLRVGNVRSKDQKGGITAGYVGEGSIKPPTESSIAIGDVSSDGQTGGITAGYISTRDKTQ